jgi:GSCFA family
MELILPFRITPSAHKISYTDKILFIGSCFTEEIGKMMKDLKFDVLLNPNGILYDPVSIAAALDSYIENKTYHESDLVLLNELWHSWQHHSIFSGMNKDEVLRNISHAQSQAYQFLKNASWLIVTFGTSYNYQLKSSLQPVANCHKAPRDFFEKKLLSIEEIRARMSGLIPKLQSFNPGLKIIFTISPVRHVRDGLIENNRSKARLIEAVHSIKENYQNVFYYPAYELVIDVLRDYRFYKDDFVHPAHAATAFVFENFCNAFVDEHAMKLSEEIRSVIAAMNHRPFQKESAAYKKFKSSQLEKIKSIKSNFPALDFSNEENFFSST